MAAARRSPASCSHPPDYPAAFLWAFPFLQNHISLEDLVMAQGIAQMFRQALELDDVTILSVLIKVVGDINSEKLLLWYSLAHNLITSRTRHNIRKSDKCLITQGLDLHVVMNSGFEPSPQHPNGSNLTPLTCVMRYSFSFYLFRQLLHNMSISFETFIDEELEQGYLKQGGWTGGMLMRLFNLKYTPLDMPAIRCRICGWKQYATESIWLSLLTKLGSIPEAVYNAAEIVEERDREILEGIDIARTVCYFCETPESISTDNTLGN